MTPDEIAQIEHAVASAIEKELGQYKVPKEQHYRDHMWISRMIEWQNTFSNEFVRGIAKTVVTIVSLLLLLGFIVWGSKAFNIGGP